jgi:sortase A
MTERRTVGLALAAVSAAFAIFLGHQLLWTDVVAERSQAVASVRLDREWSAQRLEPVPVTATTVIDLEPEVEPAMPLPSEGNPIARMTIEAIGLEVVVFAGTSTETLRQGPGWWLDSARLGDPGNAMVSGHRTTYGAPFFDLDRLVVGDKILIETALGQAVYVVRDAFVVDPSALWVSDEMVGSWLTLTTCHPKYSATERMVIRAQIKVIESTTSNNER